MTTLQEKYASGSFTALTTKEIAEFFDLENSANNFIYVINALDGFMARALYLDPDASVQDWEERRDQIWEKFTQHHESYNNYQKQDQKRAGQI